MQPCTCTVLIPTPIIARVRKSRQIGDRPLINNNITPFILIHKILILPPPGTATTLRHLQLVMDTTPLPKTACSILSPSEASKYSGRYEVEYVNKTGQRVKVLRSLRHAKGELVLAGTITPKKVKPNSDDIEGLCNLFESKASVTPKKTRFSAGTKKGRSCGVRA